MGTIKLSVLFYFVIISLFHLNSLLLTVKQTKSVKNKSLTDNIEEWFKIMLLNITGQRKTTLEDLIKMLFHIYLQELLVRFEKI